MRSSKREKYIGFKNNRQCVKYYINVVEIQRLSKDRKHEEIQVNPQFLFFLFYLMPSGSLISDSFSSQHCTPEGIDMKGIHLCKDRTLTYKPLNQSGKQISSRTVSSVYKNLIKILFSFERNPKSKFSFFKFSENLQGEKQKISI